MLICAAIDDDAEKDDTFFGCLDGVRAGHADDPGVEIQLFANRSAGHSDNAASLGADFTGSGRPLCPAGLDDPAAFEVDAGAALLEQLPRVGRQRLDLVDDEALQRVGLGDAANLSLAVRAAEHDGAAARGADGARSRMPTPTARSRRSGAPSVARCPGSAAGTGP